MRIVQLSDIHLSKTNLDSFKNYYLRALLDDLSNYQKEAKIDVVILTGDLIDKFGESFKSQDAYLVFQSEFIEPLLKKLNLTVDQLLIIPGNHDVNLELDEIEQLVEDGLKIRLKTINAINETLELTSEKFSDINKRIEKFKIFEKNLKNNPLNYVFSNNESLSVHEIEGVKIGILLVNDSWRCSKNATNQDRVIGVNQLYNAAKYFSEKETEVNIAVFHHPLEIINTIEKDEVKTILQKFQFELVLTGHTHRQNLANTYGPQGNIVFINGRSAFNDPRADISKYEPGYNIIDIDVNTLELTCFFRKYIHNRLEFDSDLDSAPGGQYKCKLVPKKEKAEYYQLFELTSKTVNNRIDEFNNLLVTAPINSIAPKALREIFVLPKISEKPAGTVKDEDNKFYSISDLLEAKENLLLLGTREVGKTTLLAKLYIDSLDLFSRLQRIPIFIDYEQLAKSDVIQIIRRQLNENKDNIDKLATNGSLLLIIDDFVDESRLQHAKNRIQRFLTEFPKNKIIASSNKSFDFDITQDQSPTDLPTFKPLYIGFVGVREFKQLSEKWFRKTDFEWHQNNTERLIKVFQILRIPRTFFAMSLYLWIVEKQEDFKPVNRSILVNKFLQYILEGLVEEEAMAGSFNFDRKKDVLSDIAFEMYNNSSFPEMYALKPEKLKSTIKRYLTENQREFDVNELYNLFISKGILKVLLEDTDQDKIEKVVFRFESFFSYFLSLNIESNSTFYKKVFSRDHTLSFIDEIDFYTGRNQRDKEPLSFALQYVKDVFKEIDEIIDDDTEKYFPAKPYLIHKLPDTGANSPSDAPPPTETQLEKALNQEFEKLPVAQSLKIKIASDSSGRFNEALELLARILKNAENIKDAALVNESLDILISKAAKFGVFIRSIMVGLFRKKIKAQSDPYALDFLAGLSILYIEESLLNWAGTGFLHLPLEKKINDQINSTKNRRDHELFLSVFIYVDLRLPGYDQFAAKAIKSLKNRFFAELYFFKLLILFKKRSKNSPLSRIYKELMILAIMKAKDVNEKQANEAAMERLNKIGEDLIPDDL